MNNKDSLSIARQAGWYYIAIIVLGLYFIMYIPSKINVSGDVELTFNNLLQHELLFRSGILAHLLSITAFILLVLSLYELLKKVNQRLAKVMAAFVIVQVPVVFISEGLRFSALMLAKERFVTSLDLLQRQEWVSFLLRIAEYADEDIAMIFWGLWMIPLGVLVFKSDIIPKLFGVLLVAGGIAYIIQSIGFILVPGSGSYLGFLFVFYAVAEISFAFWLVIKGIKKMD